MEDFEKLNVFKRDEMLFANAWLHEYGYPIYKIGHRGKCETIMAWLKEQNIISAGRWGSWQYWNMDRVYEDIVNKLKPLRRSIEKALQKNKCLNMKDL